MIRFMEGIGLGWILHLRGYAHIHERYWVRVRFAIEGDMIRLMNGIMYGCILQLKGYDEINERDRVRVGYATEGI